MTTRRVAWRRSDEVATDEHCTLTVRDGGLSLVGTVLGAEAGSPVRIEYRVLADGAGLTTAAHVRDLRGFETRTIVLERDLKGNWTVDGGKARRSRAAPTSISAAARPRTRCRSAGWGSGSGSRRRSRPPGSASRSLTVVKAAQTYTRARRVHLRYASGDFEAELSVDDDGLVGSYAEWQRTGLAMGPDDTEPLDAGH